MTMENKEGKGLLWKPIGERIQYVANDGLRYEFIDYWAKPSLLRLWEVDKNDKNSFSQKLLPFAYFCIEDLKLMGVWDILRDEQKKIVENGGVQAQALLTQEQIAAKGERKHRVPHESYVGIPRNFVCCECSKTQELAPALVIQRSKAKGVTVEEFEKSWICSKCNPVKKGRAANPKYANYPKEMKCNHPDCKVKLPQQPSMTEKLMTDKGMTLSEYCKSWFCKEHRVKKMHHFTKERLEREAKGEIKPPKTAKKREDGTVKRRGRVANPEFEGIAKGLTCSCGFFQAQHPSISISAAKNKGVDLETYFSEWRCKEHRVKKVHHMSKEGRELRKAKEE